LDHFVIINEAHLRAVLTEFARFYNQERPHRTLTLETPVPVVRATGGAIRASPVLGGLHNVYERAA
jgi:putative transposase